MHPTFSGRARPGATDGLADITEQLFDSFEHQFGMRDIARTVCAVRRGMDIQRGGLGSVAQVEQLAHQRLIALTRAKAAAGQRSARPAQRTGRQPSSASPRTVTSNGPTGVGRALLESTTCLDR